MKEALQALLDRNLPLPGVAACSARLADRTFVTHCYGDWFAPAQVEQALSRLALAADSLGYHGIQPVRLCWVFEHARIHLALRRGRRLPGLFCGEPPRDQRQAGGPAGGVHEPAGLLTAPGSSATLGFGIRHPCKALLSTRASTVC